MVGGGVDRLWGCVICFPIPSSERPESERASSGPKTQSSAES